MDNKPNWAYRRSKAADRLQREDVTSRIKLYEGLESILRTNPKDSSNDDIKTTALIEGTNGSNEDSGKIKLPDFLE